MKPTKKILLASAAVLALGMITPSDAHAFDEVNWTWNLDANKIIRVKQRAVKPMRPIVPSPTVILSNNLGLLASPT